MVTSLRLNNVSRNELVMSVTFFKDKLHEPKIKNRSFIEQ